VYVIEESENTIPEKELPANIEAEKAILGAILLECSCTEKSEWMEQWKIASILEPDDFFLDSHRLIFRRMMDLIEDDSQVDIVTLSNKLAADRKTMTLQDSRGDYYTAYTGEIVDIGGVAYLSDLTMGLPRRPGIRDYVKIVKAKSLLRKLILTCSHAVDRAYDGDSGFVVIEELKKSILEIETSATQGIRTHENI
jgi:replicative DNA helicase